MKYSYDVSLELHPRPAQIIDEIRDGARAAWEISCGQSSGRSAFRDLKRFRIRSTRAIGNPATSVIRPSLRCEVGEVVRPVILHHPARVNHMRQIVFRVGKYKSRVADLVCSIRADSRLLGRRKVRGNLGGCDFRPASRKANEAFIKMVEPRAQYLGAVAVGIGCNKYYLKPIRGGRWNFPESLSDRGQLERAHIRAMGVPEEKQRRVSLGL